MLIEINCSGCNTTFRANGALKSVEYRNFLSSYVTHTCTTDWTEEDEQLYQEHKEMMDDERYHTV